MEEAARSDTGLRRAVSAVALLNLAYFGVEFAVARRIGSVSLFADSVDFLEDASVNLLILLGLAWSPKSRARLGMLLACLLLAPALATILTAWRKFQEPVAPDAVALSTTGLGALALNLTCAFLLAKYRSRGGSITRAAFLSARNDALANVAIVSAALITGIIWDSAWPDLIVGAAIAVMNVDAAREVWTAARQEHAAAR